jgi:hypothetical protein
MSRRSREPPKIKEISPSVRLGLESFVFGNEVTIRKMLDSTDDDDLVLELQKVMSVSSISVEQLLANYFDTKTLGEYCEKKLDKSKKGSTSVLAERIAREWNKPSFDPLNATPLNATKTTSSKKRSASEEVSDYNARLVKAKHAAEEFEKSGTIPSEEQIEEMLDLVEGEANNLAGNEGFVYWGGRQRARRLLEEGTGEDNYYNVGYVTDYFFSSF